MPTSDRVSAGKLDQRITFLRPTTTQDSSGAPSRAVTQLRDVWASVEPARGYEVRQSMTEISALFVAISVRYRSAVDVLETDQILHILTGAIYDIRAISHVCTGRRLIEFTCRVVK